MKFTSGRVTITVSSSPIWPVRVEHPPATPVYCRSTGHLKHMAGSGGQGRREHEKNASSLESTQKYVNWSYSFQEFELNFEKVVG